jgi:CheY-like chemotaxis protein
VSEILSRTLGSRIRLELNLAEDAGRVEVDAAQFEASILNAVVNARDAMPNGGEITITTSSQKDDEGDFARVDISDTGLGMPQRVLERAFDPFFTTKGVGEGTGLGLSQIHGFAAQSGGRAELKSAEGAGTTLSILLPQSSKAVAASKSESDERLPEGLQVLLVEDNAQVRAFAEDLLRDLGCEVVCAASGDEALASLPGVNPDIVLSDIVMPGMSGIELAGKIRRLRPDLPVVLATGYSEQAAQDQQQFPIVLKPYSAKDLCAAMAQALRG